MYIIIIIKLERNRIMIVFRPTNSRKKNKHGKLVFYKQSDNLLARREKAKSLRKCNVICIIIVSSYIIKTEVCYSSRFSWSSKSFFFLFVN